MLCNRYFFTVAGAIVVILDVCIIWPAWPGDHEFCGPKLYTETNGHTPCRSTRMPDS